MVIKFPNKDKAGTIDNRIYSFIDLAPTVLSLVGIEPPKVMKGIAQFGKFEVIDKTRVTFHSADRFDAIYDRLREVWSKHFKYILNFDAEKSRALPITYREQMALMKSLRKLDSAKKFNETQSQWMLPTKLAEEFYDLKKDPEELIILVMNPYYKDSLNLYRKLLDRWLRETKDLGEIEEQVLLQHWMIAGKQPKIKNVQLEESGKGILLMHPKTDATIVWRSFQDSVWNIYVKR